VNEPHLQCVKREEKASRVIHGMADVTDSRCNSLFTFVCTATS